MAVAAVNIVIEQGIDYQEVFTVNNPDGSPLDLSGHTGVAKIRKFPTSTAYVPFSVGIVSTAGQVVVSLANTVTSCLSSGRYYYDVIVISALGKKSKVVDGMVLVNSTDSITQSADHFITDCTPSVGIQGIQGVQGSTGSSIWIKKTENYTASPNDQIIADSSNGIFTITLPSSPVLGNIVTIADGSNWSSIGVSVGRNGSTIEGINQDLLLDLSGLKVDFIYDGNTWEIYSSYPQSDALQGAQGTQGIQGRQGTQGISGDNYWISGLSGIYTSSNVGIGTTNPQHKLEVSGDVKVGIDTSQGVILTDSNGVSWRLIVNTNGTLSTIVV